MEGGANNPALFTLAKRVLDYDPLTRITRYFDYDPNNDTAIIHSEQDVSLILEANKVLQNDEGLTKQGIKNSWWHYAQIPNIIIEKWIRDHGVNLYNKDHQKAVFRLLNDPQYRYLKTTAKMHRG